MPSKQKLILASASPRRLQLLKQVGILPDLILPADIDETPFPREKPKDYCERIALSKAGKICKDNQNDIVLAADTIVALGARILGKPEDRAQAREFLKLLSGRQHRVYTSVHVNFKGQSRAKTVCTYVKFKKLTPKEIELHTESEQWLDKSGGYMIQGLASSFIKKINGSVSNVVGLPLMETINLLTSFGVKQSISVLI